MRNFEAIAIEMRRLEKEGKWNERNALVPLWRKDYHSYDFGFEEGEVVWYYPYPSGKPMIGKISALQEDDQIIIVGVSIAASLVKKIHHEADPQLKPPGPQKISTHDVHSKGDLKHCGQLELF